MAQFGKRTHSYAHFVYTKKNIAETCVNILGENKSFKILNSALLKLIKK